MSEVSDYLDFCRDAKRRLMVLAAEQNELDRRFESFEAECYQRLKVPTTLRSRSMPLSKRRLRLSNLLDEQLNGGPSPP